MGRTRHLDGGAGGSKRERIAIGAGPLIIIHGSAALIMMCLCRSQLSGRITTVECRRSVGAVFKLAVSLQHSAHICLPFNFVSSATFIYPNLPFRGTRCITASAEEYTHGCLSASPSPGSCLTLRTRPHVEQSCQVTANPGYPGRAFCLESWGGGRCPNLLV